MNSKEIDELGWDEPELTELLREYVRAFHRLPSGKDLETFRVAAG